MATAVHPECGTPLPPWAIEDDDPAKLGQFYQREFDVLKCEGCGRPLAPTPSLLVSFNRTGLEYVCYGPAARQHPEDIQKIEQDAETNGTVVHSDFDTPDALRERAWRLLEPRAIAFYRAVSAVLSSADQQSWEAIWPEVTSSAVAAFAASRQAGLPVRPEAVVYDTFVAASREQRNRAIQEVQARCWISVCKRRQLPNGPSTTLEDDFQKYLVTSAVLGGAPEIFFEHLALINVEENLNPGVRYAFHAAAATLHDLLRTPNPHADTWALLYLQLELALADATADQAEALAALGVGEKRARHTLDRQSLARAVSRLMGANPTDSALTSRIERAIAKAGHSDLVGHAYGEIKLARKGGGELSLDEFTAIMREQVERYADQPAELEVWLKLMRQSLPPLSPEQLLSLVREIERPHAANPITLAVVRSWFSHILIWKRQPEPVLAYIGVNPEPWESEAPFDLRCVLWLSRAGALRLTARSGEAAELLKRLDEADHEAFTKLKPHLRQQILGDLSLAFLDCGYQEAALSIQLEILNDPAFERTPWLVSAVATTYQMLGRDDDAIPLWREALASVVNSEERELQSTLQASLAAALTRRGETQEALQLLDRVPIEALDNSDVFIKYSVAVLNLGDALESSVRRQNEWDR